MKNKRLSAISDSEVSSDSSKTERNSVTKTLKKNAPSDQSSNSSSDSENEIESSKISTPLVTKRESLTSPKKSVPANPLEKFLAQNPNITKLSLDDYITEEHDVSVLDIPKNVSFDDFLGKVVNFNRKTKVKLNKTKYIIQPCRDDVKPINFLTNKLKIIHPVSYLKLYEYTKQKHDREELNINKFTPVLPENLKVRHPLFGAEYKNKIVLNEQVEKKLDNMIEKAMRKMEKKQKQKDMEASFSKESKKERKRKQQNSKIVHGETGNDESTEIRESIFALLENHLENQKRIQSLREETPETVPNASSSQENEGRIEIEDEILSPQHQKFVKNDSFNKEKKTKKKKANIEQVGTVKTDHSTPQINTEPDLEKTDSSGNKRRKESSRKNDSFGREDGESDNNCSSTKQRKRQDSMKNISEDNRKQKHHFKKEFLDSSPNESFKESLFVENGHGWDIDEVGGKKKKPNMSFKDETNSFIQPDSFEKEASHTKKQKRRSNSIKSEDFSKLTDDEGENGTRKRKHSFKNEQKDRSLDESLAENFYYERKNSQREDDIVKSNMVPVETDTSDMHKKKRKRQNSVKEEQFIDNTDSEINSKEKKKKHSFGSSNISEENSAIKNEKSKPKKEHKSKSGNESFKDSSFEAGYKKNNIVNSTVIPGLQLPIFEFDISRIGNKDEQRKDELLKKVEEEAQKQKKKKKHELFNNSEGVSESNIEVQDKLVGKQDESNSSTKKHRHNENESRSSSPKKKRKRKEDTDESGFDTSALIADLLSKVKSNLKEKSRKSTDM